MSRKLNNICVTVSLPCGRHWPPGALSCSHRLGPSTQPSTSAPWPPGAGSVAGFSTILWAALFLGPRTEGGPPRRPGHEGSGASASSRFPGKTLAPKTEACPVPLVLPPQAPIAGVQSCVSRSGGDTSSHPCWNRPRPSSGPKPRPPPRQDRCSPCLGSLITIPSPMGLTALV